MTTITYKIIKENNGDHRQLNGLRYPAPKALESVYLYKTDADNRYMQLKFNRELTPEELAAVEKRVNGLGEFSKTENREELLSQIISKKVPGQWAKGWERATYAGPEDEF